MKHRALVLAAAAAAFSGVATGGPASAFTGIGDVAQSPLVQVQYTRDGSSGSRTFKIGPNNLSSDRPRNDQPRQQPRSNNDRSERAERSDRNRDRDRRDQDARGGRHHNNHQDRRRHDNDRGRHWRGDRRYHEGRYWRPADDGWYVYNDGAWIAAGALGLAAGALLGSAVTQPQAPATVQSGAPVTNNGIPPWTQAWYQYCSGKYKSFDPQTGLYLGYDGKYHYCK